MITFCQNPVKLIAFVKSDDDKRTVLTYNMKTGQILPVAVELLETDQPHFHEFELEMARLTFEASQYHEFMKENA